jgi:hypothetical protein
MISLPEWRNGGMAEWRNGGMAEWRNGMAEWNGGIVEWRNGGMAGTAVWRKEWQNSRMAEIATYVLFTVHTHRRRGRYICTIYGTHTLMTTTTTL